MLSPYSTHTKTFLSHCTLLAQPLGHAKPFNNIYSPCPWLHLLIKCSWGHSTTCFAGQPGSISAVLCPACADPSAQPQLRLTAAPATSVWAALHWDSCHSTSDLLLYSQELVCYLGKKKKLINGTNKSETQAYFYLKVKTWPSHKYSELCQVYFNGAHNEKSILCHLYPWWNLLIRNMERLVFSACKGAK